MFGRDGVDTGLVDAMESNDNELGPSEAGKQKPSLMFKIASRSNFFLLTPPPPPPFFLISPYFIDFTLIFFSALLVFCFISLFFKCSIC